LTLTIYTVHHEVPDWALHDETYKPFLVGHKRVGGISADDWGNNIADKWSFAEMRCHYHVWKNRLWPGDSDNYVGFQHYRRQFMAPESGFEAQFVCGPDAYKLHAATPAPAWPEYIGDADIIAARRVPALATLGADYARSHSGDDWEIFRLCLIGRKRAIADVINWINPCNMFIMRQWLFAWYMADWWRVMSKVKQHIQPPLTGYQSRTFGFMSERYFTIWLHHAVSSAPELRVRELPVLIGQFQEI
jgi:Domain of unknown function (DUF4422)